MESSFRAATAPWLPAKSRMDGIWVQPLLTGKCWIESVDSMAGSGALSKVWAERNAGGGGGSGSRFPLYVQEGSSAKQRVRSPRERTERQLLRAQVRHLTSSTRSPVVPMIGSMKGRSVRHWVDCCRRPSWDSTGDAISAVSHLAESMRVFGSLCSSKEYWNRSNAGKHTFIRRGVRLRDLCKLASVIL